MKRLDCSAVSTSIVAVMLFCGTGSGCNGKKLIAGMCGLEGRTVECNSDLDCHNRGWGDVCLEEGTCIRVGQPCEGVSPGSPCEDGKVCGEYLDCTDSCWFHADCGPNGRCYCFTQFEAASLFGVPGWCRYAQCQQDGTCEMDHEPVEGTNLCRPLVFEGDCRRNTLYDCPRGYQPVGLRGCESVDATP